MVENRSDGLDGDESARQLKGEVALRVEQVARNVEAELGAGL
jgi:hypothetical protein